MLVERMNITDRDGELSNRPHWTKETVDQLGDI